MRPRWLIVGGVVVVTAALVMLATGGRYETVSQRTLQTPAGRAAAPGWTRPCWDLPRWGGERCARVSGRVVWVQRRDPDGDGDQHVILVSRFHVRIVKQRSSRAGLPAPHLGRSYKAVGLTKTGSSGRLEIDQVA